MSSTLFWDYLLKPVIWQHALYYVFKRREGFTYTSYQSFSEESTHNELKYFLEYHLNIDIENIKKYLAKWMCMNIQMRQMTMLSSSLGIIMIISLSCRRWDMVSSSSHCWNSLFIIIKELSSRKVKFYRSLPMLWRNDSFTAPHIPSMYVSKPIKQYQKQIKKNSYSLWQVWFFLHGA